MRITGLVIVLFMMHCALGCDQSMSYAELRSKGIQAGTNKRLEEAEQCLTLALQKNATAPDVHHMLGMIYGHKGSWEKAEHHLDEAVRMDPTHIRAWKLLDTVVQTRKGPDFQLKLIQVAESFKKLEPDNPEAHAYFGFRLAQAEMWDTALGAFKEAYQMAPNNRALLTNLLTVYATKGWLDEAVPFYVPLMKEDGDSKGDNNAARLNNAAHYFLLGNVFYAEAYMEQAIAYMSSAYEKCPSCHFIRFQLGRFLWQKSTTLYKLADEPDAKIDGSAKEKADVVANMALEQLCAAMTMQPEVKHYSQFLKNLSKIDACSRFSASHDPNGGVFGSDPGLSVGIKAINTRPYPLYPIDAVDPPAEAWENERCISRTLSYGRILSTVTPKIPFPTSKPIRFYIVNLGAGDGLTNDQLYDLFEFEKNRGLAVEGDRKLFKKLEENIPDEGVAKVNANVTTHTIASIFEDNNVPKEPALLKLTIDGLECPVMERILEGGWKPQVVILKINPSIPPPIRFSLQPKDKAFQRPGKDEFEWDGTPYYGCSLSYASDMMKHHGYTLLQLEWVYAVYIKDSLMWKFDGLVHDDFSVHFTGFHGREDRLRCLAFRSSISNGDPLKGAQMHINFPEMEKWYVETDHDQQVNSIKAYLDTIKHDVPYILQQNPIAKYSSSAPK